MSSLTTSHEPGYFMQQDFTWQAPSDGLHPLGGATGFPSLQSNPTNVPSHKSDLLPSYLLNLLTNRQTSPTSRSGFSKVLSTEEGTANRPNMSHDVTDVQHLSLNQLTKVGGGHLDNKEFSIASNEHSFQSLRQTGNIPHTVPADLQPMKMSRNSQQSKSVKNMMNQTGFVNAPVYGTVATSQNTNLQLQSQRQPFVCSGTPERQNSWRTASDSPLQIQQNRSMPLPQGLQNCQERQQCPSHIQRQHQIQDLMKQTLSPDFLAQLKQPMQEVLSQKVQRPMQNQQQLQLCQPSLPRWPMQHDPSTQHLHLRGQFQQVQPSQPVQQFQKPDQLLYPGQINQSGQLLSQLQLDRRLQLSLAFHQLQVQNSRRFADRPGQVQQPVLFRTPVGKTQNPQLMMPSRSNASCLITPSTMYTTPKNTFPSVNTTNADASFNHSMTHSNGMLCFSNNEGFARPYPSVAIMENQRVNTQQVGATSTNVSMRSPNLPAGISAPTSNTVCGTVAKVDSFQVPEDEPINSAAYLSSSENNLVTEEDLAKIHSEIVKSQQNTLSLQRTYESQKHVLYSTNSCTNAQLSSAEGSLVSLNGLDGECTSHVSTNPQSIDQSLEKFQNVQRIFAELAHFASQYDSRVMSSRTEQTIDQVVGSKPQNSSTSFIPSQEHVNISRTPIGYNPLANQCLPTNQMSCSATSLQHSVLNGEPITISNEQITYNRERLIPLLTRTSSVNDSLKLPNAVNCISKQKSAANLDCTNKQHCSAIANGTNYLNSTSLAVNASMTDAQMSTPSADHISEEMIYPCPAKPTSSTSSANGTMKQHSSTNSDMVFCDASSVDFLKKETKEVQMRESNGSVISGGEVERPAVTAARYTNDIVSFNLVKAVEPQVAIVNPLRVLKGKSPSELPNTEASLGNHLVIENTDKGIGDAARANNVERGIEIVSPLFNYLTRVGALDPFTPTVFESGKVGDVTNDYSCRDVDESIINQSIHFVEETKLITERNCDSTGHENSYQPYAPHCEDLKLGGASGIALDDSNLLISSFCTLVEGNAFYDPQMAEIVDAIPTVQSMASKNSYARNDELQTVGELELATVNDASTQETALTGLKYPKFSKSGLCLDQDPSNGNEQGTEENRSHAIASHSKLNFKDFVNLSEPSTLAKQMALDISNKENESAGLENNVNRNSNFHDVLTANSTVCEINKPEGQVPCTSVEKLYNEEDSSLMERGTEDYDNTVGVQGNMNYSSNNPSPNTEIKNLGHKVNDYNMDTAFETDQTHDDCESINGVPSAPSPNDQLSELLREFPYGLDTIGRKDSFKHSVLDMDGQLCKQRTISPFDCLKPNYQNPPNELPSKNEFYDHKMLLHLEGEGAENQFCENWQTLKRGLNYGKSATGKNFCISSSNTEDAENEKPLLTMDTEQTHLFASEILLSSSINMEYNPNTNLFRPETTNSKNVSTISSENECGPPEGMEIDYQTSDNLKPSFPDSLASVFANGQQVLCSPILDDSSIAPSTEEHTVCETAIGTSVEGSPEDSTIVMKKTFRSIPEDNGLKRRNTVAQVNYVKRMKLDFISDPVNAEQKIMEGKLLPKTISKKQLVKSKCEKGSIRSKHIPCEISNSVPGNTKLTIKFKDAKFNVDQQNEATLVKHRRMPELNRPFLPSETSEDLGNLGNFGRKAQNIPRLIVKMDFFNSSKAFGGIRKRTIKRGGVNSLKTKAARTARTNKGTFPSNHSCAMNKKIPCNSESNCKVPALKISLEKQSVPSEKVFNAEKNCIVEEECDSAPVLEPDISELHCPKYHCSKYHQANFEQYKKRIQTIQEYRQHQIEQAKELEEIRENNILEQNVSEPSNKLLQSAGKTKIHVNERKDRTSNSNGICLGENMQNSIDSTTLVTQSCKDRTTMENNVSQPKTAHYPEERTSVHEAEDSSNNSDVICLAGNTHTYINYSKPVTQEDVVLLDNDVSKPNQPSQPKEKNQIKTPESVIDSIGICLDGCVNLNSSTHTSKWGSDMGFVAKDAVTCQNDSFATVSKQPSTHFFNRTAFRNKTCEAICLMVLESSSSSSTKSSTEIPPQRKFKPILPKEPGLVVLQSQPELKMAESKMPLAK